MSHLLSGTAAIDADTGGTDTDAVIFDERRSTIVGSAKAPTRPDELSIDVATATAITSALAASGVLADAIETVSLSTTLATNALVEDQSQPARPGTHRLRRQAGRRIGVDRSLRRRRGAADPRRCR